MLKQLLATSALVIVGAVFIQSASAADDSKLRQLIVEPAGAHAPDAAGLPTSGKVEPSLVKADGGIATPAPVQTADAGAAAAIAANGAALGSKPVNELVVSPSGGIQTPPVGAVANPAGTPTADAGAPAGAPAGDAGAATPAAGAAGAGAPVTADPGAQPAVQGIPAAAGAAADAGQPASGDAAPAAPAIATPAAPAAPAIAVNSPDDLYKVLTGRGYGVTVSQHDAHGDEIFYVTIPGHPEDAYLLTVGAYGKVTYTKHISAYAYGHTYADDHSATYAPRYSYSPAYGSDDNCDYGTGSNAGY